MYNSGKAKKAIFANKGLNKILALMIILSMVLGNCTPLFAAGTDEILSISENETATEKISDVSNASKSDTETQENLKNSDVIQTEPITDLTTSNNEQNGVAKTIYEQTSEVDITPVINENLEKTSVIDSIYEDPISNFSSLEVSNTDLKKIDAGAKHTVVLKSDGSIYSSGLNSYGQLGTKNTSQKKIFTKASLSLNVTEISAGDYHTLALADGKVYAWGLNSSGQIGNGSIANVLTPSQITNLNGIQKISAGDNHSLALDSNGNVWSWGANDLGQLGRSDNAYSVPGKVYGIDNIKEISAGGTFSLALDVDGNVWSWGNNTYGQLGIGLENQSNALPQKVVGLSNISSISAGKDHALALDKNGKVWVWGSNSSGQLGNGGNSNLSTAAMINLIVDTKSISACGDSSITLGADGYVYVWGNNAYGQLGIGTSGNLSVPKKISLTNVVAISAGKTHSIALDEGGKVWSWGNNANGQLAIGSTVGSNVPVQTILLLTRTIHGKVSLPQGVSTPVGGINVTVKAKGSFAVSENVIVNIAEGANSKTFEIIVPDAPGYYLIYTGANTNATNDYASTGYYAGENSVLDSSKAKVIDTTKSDVFDIDFKLIAKKTISGTLTLPEAATSQFDARVYAGTTFYADILIPAGSKTVNYAVKVNPNEVDEKYKVYYKHSYTTDPYIGYVESGYYSLSGTVVKSALATTVDAGATDIKGVNLQVIPKNRVTGRIVLPTGSLAPTGGYSVKLTVSNSTFGKNDNNILTISEGSNSVAYDVYVVPDTGYKISYTIQNTIVPETLIKTGYYNYVRSTTAAEIFDFSKEGRNDLDIKIIPKIKVSGQLTIPLQKVAPPGNLSVTMKISDGTDTTKVYTFTEGTKTLPFELYVPEGSNYKLSYSINSNDYFVETGYFSNEGTLIDSSGATTLSTLHGSVTGINFLLLDKKKISGLISLPQNTSADSDIEFEILAKSSTNAKSTDKKSFIIEKGTSSVAYTVYVPSDCSYYVNFSTDNRDYVDKEYYNHSGTVMLLSGATLFDVSDDVSGIDITLIKRMLISGKLKLQSSKSEYIEVKMSAMLGSTRKDEATVVITPGQTEVDYLLKVPAASTYTIKYEVVTGNTGLVTTGYYGKGATVTTSSSATNVDASLVGCQDIDLTLLEKRVIGGRISLPEGELAEYPHYFTFHGDKEEDVTIIQAGTNSGTYNMVVPPDKYYIYCDMTSEIGKYVNKTYYSVGGPVRNQSSATLVDATTGDQLGINLVLIKKKIISGTITLPSGVAPSGGIFVIVRAKNSIDTGYTIAYIEPGQSSTKYNLYMPAGENYKVYYDFKNAGDIIKDLYDKHWYEVYYELNDLYSVIRALYINDGEINADQYIESAYYNENGMVLNATSATLLDVSKSDLANINLSLIDKRKVTGKIQYPNGTAPADIIVSIKGTNGVDSGSVDVTIKQNYSEANFTLYLPAGNNYKLYCELKTNNDYVEKTYYSESGMVRLENLAKLVDMRFEDLNNINMSIVKKREISGTVYLPSEVLDKSVSVNVVAVSDKDPEIKSQNYSIAVGSLSVDYKVFVPADSGFKIKYVVSATSDFISDGYYSKNGTIVDNISADTLDLTESSLYGIDLTLIQKRTISGTISLPEGQIAPDAGISVTIFAGEIYKKTVKILARENSTTYELYAEPNADEGYKVWYQINSQIYVPKAYYSEFGMKLNEEEATVIDLIEDRVINLTVISAEDTGISGTISLPNGQYAPYGGYKASIIAYNSNGNYTASVIINEKQSSAKYVLNADPKGSYKVKYNIKNDAYLDTGFYNALETKKYEANADTVILYTGAKTGIDLQIIDKKILSGTVSLPNNKVAVSEIKVTLKVYNSIDSAEGTVIIPAGQSSSNFSMYVPEGSAYKVEYEVDNVQYLKTGFYSTNGVVRNLTLASSLDIVDNLEHAMNLVLIPNNVITGKLLLHSVVAPYGGLTFKLTAKNSIDTMAVSVVVPEGDNIAPFEIYVPFGDGYTLYYETSNEQFVKKAYYFENGVTELNSSAKILNLSNTPQNGINIEPIEKKAINGILKLSDEGIASLGGVRVTVKATNGSETISSSFVIPEYGNSVNYTLYVKRSDDKYKVSYQTQDIYYLNSGYYYSELVTVRYEDDAGLVDMSSSNQNNINLTLTQKRLISGTVSLPEGINAPIGGIKVTINATNSSDSTSTSVVVPQFNNSIAYKIYVPAGSDYILSYSVESDDYVKLGYYKSNTESTLSVDETETLNPTSLGIKDVKLYLIPRHMLSGEVWMPEGQTSPVGGLNVTVMAGAESTIVSIPQGSSYAEYSLKLSPNNNKGYVVKYKVAANSTYVANGYYSESEETKTTMESSKATYIYLDNADVANIDLTLIPKRTIKGSIFLQSEAPSGGLKVLVSVDATSSSVTVNIPEGGTESSYELYVAPNAKGSGYKIKYTLENDVNYVKSAYYSSSGMTINSTAATLIDVSDLNRSGVNLTLIPKNTISGIIELPNGNLAPEEGIIITVVAKGTKGTYSKEVVIPSGSNQTTYSLNVPAANGYKVYAVYNGTLKYTGKTYYSVSGSTACEDQASYLTVPNGDLPNINMKIVALVKIAGCVALPAGQEVTLNEIEVKVIASNKYFTNIVNTTIAVKNRLAEYQLYIVPYQEYNIKYQLASNTDYMQNGYYSENGTSYTLAGASKVNVLDKELALKELTLLEYQRAIYGSITLPNNKVAEDNISVVVKAVSKSIIRTKTFVIPKGYGTVQYRLPVPDKSQYIMSYEINSNKKYVEVGYGTTSNGTVLNKENAEYVIVDSADSIADFNLIPKMKISGSIQLPSGVASTDISVDLVANDSDRTTVTIHKDESSAIYELWVAPTSGYKVRYEVSDSYGYVNMSYYGGSITTRNPDEALPVNVSLEYAENINLKLIVPANVTGKVMLSGRQAPSGGMNIRVIAENSIDSISQDITIVQGISEKTFSLNLPPNNESTPYKLRYEAWGYEDILSVGYYKEAGVTDRNRDDAKLMALSSGQHPNKDLTLINKTKISGKITLPKQAGQYGEVVTIKMSNAKDYAFSNVTISAGYNEADYSIYVPQGEDYTLWYELQESSDFVEKCYYSTTMTVNKEDATSIDVSSEALSGYNITVIEKRVIGGHIVLPENVSEPNGLLLQIQAENEDSQYVTIPYGSNSIGFTLKVNPNVKGKAGYKIRYILPSTAGYVTTAYYIPGSSVRSAKLATDIDVSVESVSNIIFNIMKLGTIKGTVSLPKVAQNNLSVDIIVSNGLDSKATTITIAKDTSKKDYELNIPPNELDPKYKVYYENWYDDSYMRIAYYNEKSMVTTNSEASLIEVTNTVAVEDIDLSLVAKRKITGQVNLPGIARNYNLPVTIILTNGIEKATSEVTITKGMTSVAYAVYAPAGNDYRLYYKIGISGDYIETGYYKEGGALVLRAVEASIIDLSNNDLNDIDITLIQRMKFSGVIKVDSCDLAGGIDVLVVVSNGVDGSSSIVHVPYSTGSKSVNYSVFVPPAVGYKVHYQILTESKFDGIRYYKDATTTVATEEEATAFNAMLSNPPSINMKLASKRTIRGTIYLPNGNVADYSFSMFVIADNGELSGSSIVNILKGQSSASYTLWVTQNSSDDKFKVHYINHSNEDYMAEGYYGSQGETVLEEYGVAAVDVSSANATDVNLTLIAKNTVKGKIYLPSGVAPEGGTNVNVFAQNIIAGKTDMTTVTIESGANFAEYSLKIAPRSEGTTYYIGYETEISDDYMSEGYYNSLQTVANVIFATSINAENPPALVDMTLLAADKLSGVIYLPIGVEAPAEGISVNVFAEVEGFDNYVVESNVVIPEGLNSAEYILKLPKVKSEVLKVNVKAENNKGTDSIEDDISITKEIDIPLDKEVTPEFKIGYELSSTGNYYKKGYYAGNKIVLSKNDAEVITTNSKASIELNVVELSRKISGELQLGDSIAENALEVDIIASNSSMDNSITKTVQIEAGNASVGFEIAVPAADGYRLAYAVRNSNGTVSSGYYGGIGIVGKEAMATSIDVMTADVSNISMTLSSGSKVAGIIALPGGNITTSDVYVRIKAESESYEAFTDVIISNGSNSKEYQLVLPVNKNYIISAQIISQDERFIERVYYNSEGTTTKIEYASNVIVDSTDKSDINIKLLLAERTISGLLSIPDVAASVSYSLQVPLDSNDYIVSYDIGANDLYTNIGYYNKNETLTYKDYAQKVDVENKNCDNVDLTLVKKGYIPLCGIELESTEVYVQIENTVQLSVKYANSDATDKSVKWYSSNTNFVTVDLNNGLVTGISPTGDSLYAIVTAVAKNGMTRSCKVYVKGIIINQISFDYFNELTPMTIKPAGKGVITAVIGPNNATDKTVVWSSSDKKVATVIGNNVAGNIVTANVTGVAQGTAIITARNSDGSVSAICQVVVSNTSNIAVTSVSLDKSSMTLGIGRTSTLTATVNPTNATNKTITWSSDKTDIAAVNSSGFISAKASGTAKIIAECFNSDGSKKSATCNLTVKPLAISIYLEDNSATLYVGDPGEQIVARCEPADSLNPQLTYTSKNDRVATVTSSGIVNAKAVGACDIVIKNNESGVTRLFHVNVTSNATPTKKPTPTPTKKKSSGGGGGGGGGFAFATTTPTPTNPPAPTPTKDADGNTQQVSAKASDIKGHWSEKFVTELIKQNIVSGYEDNTFRPNNQITRAEVVVVISRMLKLKPADNPQFNFADNGNIPKWAAGYIKVAVDEGIISGYENGTFRSSGNLTRDEMTAIIIRAMKMQPDTSNNSSFIDEGGFQKWAKGYIAKASELGLIKGYGDNSFKPKNNITRAEVCVICYKALELMNK